MAAANNEQNRNVQQRTWGAVVFIAVMVIVLPVLLDGSGSESEYGRRVRTPREEPPVIMDPEGNWVTLTIPEMRPVEPEGRVVREPSEVVEELLSSDLEVDDERPDYLKAEQEVNEALKAVRNQTSLTAWVVQAASFSDQQKAVLMRDRLRHAGFASFVRDRDVVTEPFRVLVGPLITEESAYEVLQKVTDLLDVDALVLTYP